MNKAIATASTLALLSLPLAVANASEPAPPFANPWLADSVNMVTHGRGDFTSQAGPVGPSMRLPPDRVTWKPLGTFNSSMPLYSRPYANGKRVIWVGGYDRIAKLDADTLDVLTTYAIGGNTYFGAEETERAVDAMDKLGDGELIKYNLKLWEETWPVLPSWYRLLTQDNELFLSHRNADGSIAIRVYGEADSNDPSSKIKLKREFKVPTDVSAGAFPFGMHMTSDGTVIVVLQNGAMIALARDFSISDVLRLPNKGEDAQSNDIFKSFVRNALATDDQNGIYVVTRDNLHRVQWTGKKLSLDPADGAWAVAYPNEKGFGSGTTPALMGWGPNEDHLVVIADATQNNNMVAFWRDAIPADWKGLPGYDRRVAAITPIHFGGGKDERVQIENAIMVYGYGAFLDNTELAKPLPNQMKNRGLQWLADSYSMHIPEYAPRGGTKIEWDPKARTLNTVWNTQLNFASSICQISSATKIVYCWGARDREWTLEGLDWASGKSAFHYTLGKSHRYNVYGGPVIIAPNGAVDCGCMGGLGLVRIWTPQQARQRALASKMKR